MVRVGRAWVVPRTNRKWRDKLMVEEKRFEDQS